MAALSYWMIGVPTYDGRVDMNTAQSVRAAVSAPHPVRVMYSRSSLLPQSFNEIVCAAINDEACEWFAMLHADVEPEAGWLTQMVGLALAESLDVLSAVLPMRDDTGLTSTALDMPLANADARTRQRRLTITEALSLPGVFRAAEVCRMFGVPATYRYVHDPADRERPRALLVNTGLMLLRASAIRRHAKGGTWPGFQIASCLVNDDDGRVRHHVEPEDWRFSRWAARQHALSVAATTVIRANHHGADAVRPNHVAWGMWQTDEDFANAEAAGVSLEQAAGSTAAPDVSG